MLSIVIPVKNMERYIKKAIKSIYSQKNVDKIEIIIVDFGSTDNTINIVKEFKSNVNITIILYENIGKDVVEARNFGLSVAKGEYISFIDADDWIDEKFYEIMLKNIKREKADIVICGFKNVNEIDNVINNKKTFENNAIQLNKTNINEFMTRVALGEINCEAWNKIYRKKFIDDAKVKFDNVLGVNGEDMLFNYFLYINLPKVSFGIEELYYHLIRQNSLGKIKEINISDRLNYIIKEIKRYSKEKEIYDFIKESIAMQYLSLIIFQLTNNKSNFTKKIKNYKENITLKEEHREYIKLCILSKYSNLKRKILALTIYMKLDIIFILFSCFI